PGPAVPADSASWARALPVAESTMAVPMARASRERRERPAIVDAVMVSLPGILIRDHDPNRRIVNTYGQYRPAAGSACRRDSAWFVHGSGCWNPRLGRPWRRSSAARGTASEDRMRK